MFKLTAPLLALAISCAAPQAIAANVSFPGFAHGSESVTVKLVTLPTGDVNKTVNAGGFLTSLNGGPSFESYCVDVYQTIAFGPTYTDYTLPGTSHLFANSDAYADLGRLYANVGTITDAMHEAAFQLAVWEIAYETGTSYDLASGSASFLGSAATLLQAKTWLDNLGLGVGQEIRVLTSTGHQDVIIAVPEPETYALFMAGLAAVGFMARRRKS